MYTFAVNIICYYLYIYFIFNSRAMLHNTAAVTKIISQLGMNKSINLLSTIMSLFYNAKLHLFCQMYHN